METARPSIESFGHELRVELPREPLLVHGDLTRLTQIFANLLNNAAKYTPPKGRIVVAAARDGERLRVVVRDNGVGLASDQLAKVFDMFAQFTPALERTRDGGLGIGLALARGLVELHGGRISVYSAGSGCGSEFVVQLPLHERAGDSAATARR